MSSVSNISKSPHAMGIIWENEKYIFYNRAHKRVECDPTIESMATGLVREYGFEAEKGEQLVSNLVAWLGKTDQGEIDQLKANQKFQELVERGLITIERVGFRKVNKGGAANGAPTPKFYLMINQPLGKGSNSQFHVGFSRKGTLRAILRDLKGRPIGAPELAKELSEKEFIPECFSRRSLRIMNEDPQRGITILQLGGENLRRFPIAKLPREARWKLYLSIVQGLHQIHKLGVHRDIKPDNLVIDEEGCAKFIDFGGMKQEGRVIGSEKNGQVCPALEGSLLYHSPKELAAFVADKPIAADKKDDICSTMLTICELESKVPESDRMLSPEFIERFKQYNDFRFGMARQFQENSYRDARLFEAKFVDGPWKRNIFQNVHEILDSWPYPQLADAVLGWQQYPLNPLIYSMAATRSSDRVDAATLLFSFADPQIQSRVALGDIQQKSTFFSRLFGPKN